MTSPADQIAIAVANEVEQAGSPAVLLKYISNPAKELSGELRRLNNLSLPLLLCRQFGRISLLQVEISDKKRRQQLI